MEPKGMSGYRQHQDQEGQLGVPSQQLHDAFDLYFESKSGIRMGRNFSFANGPFKCIFPSARQSLFRSQLLVENCYVPGVSIPLAMEEKQMIPYLIIVEI